MNVCAGGRQPVLSAPNRPGRTALALTLALFVGVALTLNALIFGLEPQSLPDLIAWRLVF